MTGGKLSDPLKVLKGWLGEEIRVELKDGRLFRGKLSFFDTHLNLRLSETCDLENDSKEGKRETLIVRGNNVAFVSSE